MYGVMHGGRVLPIEWQGDIDIDKPTPTHGVSCRRGGKRLVMCSDAAATVDIPMKTWLIFCELIHRLKPHALESGSFNLSLFQLIVGNSTNNYCITVMKHTPKQTDTCFQSHC